MSLPRNLHEATQADLQRLVETGAEEGPHIDFKRDVPSNWDARKTADLCIDALAFANAGGGDLVYGIEEDGAGRAEALTPTTGVNGDETARRMLDILLNNVEPRLPGVQVHPISCDGSAACAIVVRVPASWIAPHRFKPTAQFYVRESARKRQLDLPEIRGAFLRTESQAQRLRDFRTDRIGKLMSGLSPVRLVAGPIIMVHLIPTQSALGIGSVDPIPYTVNGNRQLPILGVGRGVSRVNLDGALAVRSVGADGKAHGYSLFFRNGYFETVNVLANRGAVYSRLPSFWIAEQLSKLLTQFTEELQHLNLIEEFSLQFSLIGASSLRLGVDESRFMLEDYQTYFDREVVVLPDCLVEAGTNATIAARPTLDMLWQAAGFERCWDYNPNGELVRSS